MTDPTRDEIRQLLERSMTDTPEPLPWNDVERRATDHGDPPAGQRRTGVWLAAAASIVAFIAGFVVLIADDDSKIRTNNSVPTTTTETDLSPAPTVPVTTGASTTSVAPSTSSTATTQNDQTSRGSTELTPPESGETQRTVIGDITWTLIEGDASTQPTSVHARIDNEFVGAENDELVWRSSDGVTWELTERRPNGVVRVFELDGETWARTSSADEEGFARWDGATFVPVELPESLAPRVDGLAESVSFPAGPVEFGDELIMPIMRRLTVPWNDLFLRQVFPEWDAVTQTIRLFDPESNDPLPVAVLTTELVEGDPGNVELRDAETGELVTTVGLIPGVDPDDFIRRLVIAGGYSYSELLIGGRDGFKAVEAPWRFADGARIVALDGRMLSVVPNVRFDDGGSGAWEWELWTSVDARTWIPLELPTSFGSQIDHIDIVSDGSLALLTIVSNDGSVQRPETWSTVNGETWEPVEAGGGFGGTEFTEIGWFRDRLFDGGGISVSPDGLVWQEIPIDFDQLAGAGGGGGGSSVLGRTIFVTRYEDGGDRTMWVGRVADR